MAEPISIQQLKDASEDAISLAEFINKPENVMIPRRLASDIHSLQYYLDYMKSFAQRSYETYDEMVANASNLSGNVSVFVTNDSDTSKNGIYTYNGTSFVKGEYQPENAAKKFVEDRLGGLEVFDGKVRTQDVSTEDGSTQDVKNTEFRNELDSLPFEDGVLADTFVVDGSLTQRTINRGLESIADLSTIQNPKDGLRVYVKSYHAGLGKGSGYFIYDSAKSAENNGGTVINGWVRVLGSELSTADFGVLPDTEIDVTEAICNAAKVAAEFNKPLRFESGRYLVDGSKTSEVYGGKGIVVPSNSHFIMSNQTTLKLIANDQPHAYLLHFKGVDNVLIEFNNAKLIGDKHEHLNTSGERGDGIELITSSNVTLKEPNISSMFGDGIYINSIKDCKILNPVIDDCRRQGISIIDADGLVIDNPIISNTSGTAPSSGIDFEPNTNTAVFKNIRINNLTSINNAGSVFEFAFWKLAGSQEFVDIIIDGVYGDAQGKEGVFFKGNNTDKEQVKGKIVIKDCYLTNIKRRVFRFQAWSKHNPDVILIRPTVKNTNLAGQSGISGSPVFDFAAVDISGNIIIDNPVVIEDENTATVLVYHLASYGKAGDAENVEVILRDAYTASKYVFYNSIEKPNGLRVQDNFNLKTIESDTDINTISYSAAFASTITMTGSSSASVQLKDRSGSVQRYKIINLGTDNRRLRVQANYTGASILPAGTFYYDTTEFGANMVITNYGTDKWFIESMSGTWTPYSEPEPEAV